MKLLSGTKKQTRQLNALKRLEAQLVKGTKPCTERQDFRYDKQIPLTESDITRIKSEITILKSKL